MVNRVISSAIDLWFLLVDPVRLWWSRKWGGQGDPGLVSIPIATFDRLDVLVSRTLPHLLSQSYPHIEVIIVCDGSSTDFVDGLRRINDPRVRVAPLRRRSHYPTDPLAMWCVAGSRPRNHGARLARGEFLLWMSDDDIIVDGAIESLVTHLREHPTCDAVGGIVQSGIKKPRMNNPSEAPERIGLDTGAMPGWLHRRALRAFRWNSQSWRKEWNRPVDYDLSERMRRNGIVFGAISQLVAIQPEVTGTNVTGSAGAVWEELKRRQ